MAQMQGSRTRALNGIFWVALVAAIVLLILRHTGVASNVAVVLLGFGSVVLVHEFGHFIIAKLGGIKVEAFSLFMPPTLLGIRKTKTGFKFRFLPSLYERKASESSEGTPEPPAEEFEETEYRIGVFPFGGYVKLLGQEDTGPVRQVGDPRSFANKPVRIRAAVIAAGVTFNVISAAIIFMIVFLVGIDLPPAVIGEVFPKSPAAKAGLQPGDEFLMIDGKTKDLDFSNVLVAGALSSANEPVPVTIRHADGSVQETTLVAEKLPGSQFRDFGIEQPESLTVAQLAGAEPNLLRERTGLMPGDRIVAVNGQKVDHYWDFAAVVRSTLGPEITITAERSKGTQAATQVETKLPLDWAASDNGRRQIGCRFEQRLLDGSAPARSRRNRQEGPCPESRRTRKKDTSGLKAGDIILAAGQIQDPTYKELRDITIEYEGKSLPIKVLRTDANGVEQEMAVDRHAQT